MKHQSYYDRSLKAADPRYARIFEKMGYGRRDMQASEAVFEPLPDADDKVKVSRPIADGDISALRAEYEQVIGKKPFNGWKADQLREKIAAAQTKA